MGCKKHAASFGETDTLPISGRGTFEVYAKQALNTEAERKAGEIRLRAERRAGQLLTEMKQNGQRASVSDGASGRAGRLDKPSLRTLGVTKDQSSQWQQIKLPPDKAGDMALAADPCVSRIRAHQQRTDQLIAASEDGRKVAALLNVDYRGLSPIEAPVDGPRQHSGRTGLAIRGKRRPKLPTRD